MHLRSKSEGLKGRQRPTIIKFLPQRREPLQQESHIAELYTVTQEGEMIALTLTVLESTDDMSNIKTA